MSVRDFAPFLDWAADRKIGLDFNPTFFAHPMAASGLTLSSPDKAVREFWIRHGIACRKIAEAFGKRLKNCAITNFWIPDGYKDVTADRLAPRERLIESLDEIFAVKIDPKCATRWSRNSSASAARATSSARMSSIWAMR